MNHYFPALRTSFGEYKLLQSPKNQIKNSRPNNEPNTINTRHCLNYGMQSYIETLNSFLSETHQEAAEPKIDELTARMSYLVTDSPAWRSAATTQNIAPQDAEEEGANQETQRIGDIPWWKLENVGEVGIRGGSWWSWPASLRNCWWQNNKCGVFCCWIFVRKDCNCSERLALVPISHHDMPAALLPAWLPVWLQSCVVGGLSMQDGRLFINSAALTYSRVKQPSVHFLTVIMSHLSNDFL